ncbi:MAG: hypothetical protein AAF718_03815 [Pseudomonadota bacterium]
MSPLTVSVSAKLVALLLFAPTVAHAWSEPPRGSELRSEILGAIRSVVAVDLNPPLEFIVNELRQEGDIAFGALQPQRPGGAAITWDSTAIAARGEPEDWYDGTTVHAFVQRVDGAWLVEDYSIGATDVWWFKSPLCANYQRVIPEYC